MNHLVASKASLVFWINLLAIQLESNVAHVDLELGHLIRIIQRPLAERPQLCQLDAQKLSIQI